MVRCARIGLSERPVKIAPALQQKNQEASVGRLFSVGIRGSAQEFHHLHGVQVDEARFLMC